jgi:nitroreductase
MDLYYAMSTTRAVRRLRPDPIPDDMLDRVLTAATWAPTGGNVQPFRMLVVRAPEKKQALQALYAPRWRDYTATNRKRLGGEASTAAAEKLDRTLRAGDHLAEHLGEVPVIVVFCFNPKIMAITDIAQDRPSVVGGGSVYPAVQNLLLACRNEGLGCVLTTLLCMDEPAVKSLLAIPDPWGTCAYVPIGWPVGGGHGPLSRRPLGKLTYEDSWEHPWTPANAVETGEPASEADDDDDDHTH